MTTSKTRIFTVKTTEKNDTVDVPVTEKEVTVLLAIYQHGKKQLKKKNPTVDDVRKNNFTWFKTSDDIFDGLGFSSNSLKSIVANLKKKELVAGTIENGEYLHFLEHGGLEVIRQLVGEEAVVTETPKKKKKTSTKTDKPSKTDKPENKREKDLRIIVLKERIRAKLSRLTAKRLRSNTGFSCTEVHAETIREKMMIMLQDVNNLTDEYAYQVLLGLGKKCVEYAVKLGLIEEDGDEGWKYTKEVLESGNIKMELTSRGGKIYAKKHPEILMA